MQILACDFVCSVLVLFCTLCDCHAALAISVLFKNICLRDLAVLKVDIAVLLRQNAEILEQQKIHASMLQELLRRQRGSDAIRLGRLPDSIKLPVMTFAAVQDLKNNLKSDEMYKQLVSNCLKFIVMLYFEFDKYFQLIIIILKSW